MTPDEHVVGTQPRANESSGQRTSRCSRDRVDESGIDAPDVAQSEQHARVEGHAELPATPQYQRNDRPVVRVLLHHTTFRIQRPVHHLTDFPTGE